jgi:geranylgeranyl diphosphate synthase type II
MDRAAATLESLLVDGKRQIDDEVDQAVPSLGTPPAALVEAMRYALRLPSKRLRGILALAASDLFKSERADTLPLACAVEMVHAASSILDDLPSMGNAAQRGGKPALHRVVGEANAILAAVGLINEAFAHVQNANQLPERVRLDAERRLTVAVGGEGMIGGHVIDLESVGKQLDLEGLEFIRGRKTGALFVAAAQLGSLPGKARARDLDALSAYAKNLGLALQITEDLLDYSGSPDTTGKDGGMDQDRTTFVNLRGIDGARRRVDELIDASLDALTPFGRRARMLGSLAEYVRVRDR